MKIHRISQYQPELDFPNLIDHYQAYRTGFFQTDLGMVDRALPWLDMIKALGLRDSRKGPMSIFSPKGKLALLFLKHHCCCSDKKLIEHINGNIYYQMFCDIYLSPGTHITNFKIVSQIRCEIGGLLKINEMEEVLASYWRPYMSDLESISCDATCYESSIRYPTDVKLLWESVEWSYSQLKKLSKQVRQRVPRTKKIKWTKRYVSYSKMRRKTKQKRRSLTRGLLRLLEKIDGELTQLESIGDYVVVPTYENRRATIRKVLSQQSDKFYRGVKPKDRIVSIDKPYLRPIVRGKEIKMVEFGAKVHKLQIDGISFIEHLSYDAFNEGTRIQSTIYKAQKLSHRRVRILGADAIYATNKNRKYLTGRNIQTDFKRKGRAGKHEKHKRQIAKMITKERASRLEGSFGTDKEYFLLNKIKARTQKTETLWIFIGIHTSNALKIGRRMALTRTKAA